MKRSHKKKMIDGGGGYGVELRYGSMDIFLELPIGCALVLSRIRTISYDRSAAA